MGKTPMQQLLEFIDKEFSKYADAEFEISLIKEKAKNLSVKEIRVMESIYDAGYLNGNQENDIDSKEYILQTFKND